MCTMYRHYYVYYIDTLILKYKRPVSLLFHSLSRIILEAERSYARYRFLEKKDLFLKITFLCIVFISIDKD